MKLKSLTINGFKSFADKTKIEFQPGITGIVGPNGSGKSNIIEALRWTLGEQSAKSLRGWKMPDVIFAGSTQRSSLSRAEVSVEFDNSDHFFNNYPLTFTITRRLYRNGESEYLINNKKVRLKDIVELFMDTGVGKESFSIISQGSVEKIFNSCPADRRMLVEETAGIYKYKKEKEKAQKELSETDNHLERITDILTELQHQREPLAQQASLARDYLNQKKQYDYYYLNFLVVKIQNARIQEDEIEHQLSQTQALLQKYEAQTQAQEDKTTTLRSRQQQLEHQLDELQKRLVAFTQQKERLKGEEEIKKQQVEFQCSQQQELTTQLATNIKDLARQKQLSEDLSTKHNELLISAQNLKAQIKVQKEKIVTPTTLEKEIHQLRSQLDDKLESQLTFKNQLTFLTQDLEHHQQLLTINKNKQEQLLNSQNKLKKVHQSLMTQLFQVESTLKHMQEHLDDLKLHHHEVEECLDKQRQRWYQANEIMQKVKGRYEALQGIMHNYSGYYQGVRALLKKRSRFKGIRGAVAELLKVAPQYSCAIETVLGVQLQYVVVDNEQTAKECINFLKNNHLGRATFLPQNVIKGRSFHPEILQRIYDDAGFIGVASELAKFDTSNDNILKYLLGNTLIVKDIESAIRIANKINHQLKIVSLNGDVVNAGGSMTGGSTHQQGGLLQRQQELLQLKSQLKEVKLQLNEVQQGEKRPNEHLLSLKREIQSQEQNLEKQQQTKRSLMQQIDTNKLQLANLTTQLQELVQSERKNALKEQEVKHRQLITKLSALEKETISLKTKLEHQQLLREQFYTSQQTITETLSKLEQKEALNNERLTQVKVQIHENDAQKAQLEHAISQLKTTLEKMKSLSEHHQVASEELKVKYTQLKKECETLTTKIAHLQAQRTQLHQQYSEAQQELKRLDTFQQQTADEYQQQSLQRNQILTKLKQYLMTLNEKYSLTFERAESQVTEHNLQKITHHLKLLKYGLDELGEVNLGAIKEFERVNHRFNFLDAQQKDLKIAQKNLLQSMNEIDIKVKKDFKETFEKIAEAFKELFPKIFGGGTANLYLTDPHELLTTGIEIMAQPPGKKNQRLSLLSGGERSLTAITLLFAILKVRPVPFVILDEAEAALDEANVARYAHYLKHFGDHTQFIIITHRKGMMMQADVLYGVTMQESGVSKMVSISLDKMIN